jgi:uncharacterized protein
MAQAQKHPTVDLAALEGDRLELEGTLEPGDVDLSADRIRQIGILRWSGFAERSSAHVQFAGCLQGQFELVCVRCLEPVEEILNRKFDLFFRERDSLVFDENEEIELEEADTSTAFIVGTELALVDIFREQILLAGPMKPVCRDECKGLCSTCGTNLNDASCGCPKEKIDSPFEQLLELKKQLER